MAESYQYYMKLSRKLCDGGSVTQTVGPLQYYTSTKQAYARRTRPKGIELLFNVTEYTHSRGKWLDTPFYVWMSCPPTQNGKYQVIYTFRNNVGSFGVPSLPIEPSTAVDINRLLSKIKGQKVNLAVALGEYRATASMFESAVKSLVSSYRAARRGKPPSWLVKPRLGNGWLCYTYGITPLINDLTGSLQLLETGLSRPLLYSVKTGRGENTSTTTSISAAGGTHIIERTQAWSRRSMAHIELDNSMLPAFSSLGLTNPLELGWELVPYSFVVDWFLSVGDYLSGLDSLIGVKRYSAFYTLKKSTREVHYFAGNIAKAESEYTTRRKLVLTPQFTVEPSVSWRRVVSAMALATQRLPHNWRGNVF